MQRDVYPTMLGHELSVLIVARLIGGFLGHQTGSPNSYPRRAVPPLYISGLHSLP